MRMLIRFGKNPRLRFISHLDLMRVFQRAFKRAGLNLKHTQGFNPRPSVSIALPLSKLLVGTKIGTMATVPPMVIAAFPLVARMVESSLREVNHGVIEAAHRYASSSK